MKYAAALAVVMLAALRRPRPDLVRARVPTPSQTPSNPGLRPTVSSDTTFLYFPAVCSQIFQNVANFTVNRLDFENTGGYEFTGMPFRIAGANARLRSLTQGFVQFQSNIQLAAPFTIENSSSSVINFAGGIISDPDGPQPVTIAGTGSSYTQFIANQTYRGGTAINAGNLRLLGGTPGTKPRQRPGTLGGTGPVPATSRSARAAHLPGPASTPALYADSSLTMQGDHLRLEPRHAGLSAWFSDVVTVLGAHLVLRQCTINVQPITGFGVGSYRLFNFDPTIPDLTLDAVVHRPSRRLLLLLRNQPAARQHRSGRRPRALERSRRLALAAARHSGGGDVDPSSPVPAWPRTSPHCPKQPSNHAA